MKFELERCVVRVCGVFVGCRFDVGSMLVRCWFVVGCGVIRESYGVAKGQ